MLTRSQVRHALDGHRCGMNEPWFSSTTNADKHFGPGNPDARSLITKKK